MAVQLFVAAYDYIIIKRVDISEQSVTSNHRIQKDHDILN
jgi:hypothetical protein